MLKLANFLRASQCQLSLFQTTRKFTQTSAVHRSHMFTDDREYHKCADDTLENLVDQMMTLEDDPKVTLPPKYDCEYSAGVLNIRMGSHGTFVLNKQPPNHEIWLSSPISGPKRFQYSTSEQQCWKHTKPPHEELEDSMSTELQQMLKCQPPISFQRPK